MEKLNLNYTRDLDYFTYTISIKGESIYQMLRSKKTHRKGLLKLYQQQIINETGIMKVVLFNAIKLLIETNKSSIWIEDWVVKFDKEKIFFDYNSLLNLIKQDIDKIKDEIRLIKLKKIIKKTK